MLRTVLRIALAGALAAALTASRVVFAQGLATDAELLDGEEEPRQYTVEIIVFAYAPSVSAGTEVFLPEIVEIVDEPQPGTEGLLLEGPIPDDSVPTERRRAGDATGPGDLATDEAPVDDDAFNYVLLGDDELQMTDTLDRLDRLDAYEPLLHVGWTQTTLPEADTPALTIADLAEPPAGLDGTFTLYLSRYLHLVVDLELDAERGDERPVAIIDPLTYESTLRRYGNAWDPLAPRVATRVEPLRYAISENRIMKNGDVRYYDHPRFGVIARVDRVEADADPADDDPRSAPSRVAPAGAGQ